jgi:uncharacterized protein YbjT (DUF2867 family)
MRRMSPGSVLVAGATGQLGGEIVRQLLAAGVPVRALARRREKLAGLEQAGAELAAVDLLDAAKVQDACRGIDQIISTANNNMGAGAATLDASTSRRIRTCAPVPATRASGGWSSCRSGASAPMSASISSG